MTTAFMVFRPFAPDLEVHLSCKKGLYHLKIICRERGTSTTLNDDDHHEPASVMDTITALVYSRSQPNIGTISRLVYGLNAHPELALREFRGVSVQMRNNVADDTHLQRP